MTLVLGKFCVRLLLFLCFLFATVPNLGCDVHSIRLFAFYFVSTDHHQHQLSARNHNMQSFFLAGTESASANMQWKK